MTSNKVLADWVTQVKGQVQADHIHWCDGTPGEYGRLVEQMLKSGVLKELNQITNPRCYLHRSDPQDVARVEHLTYICSLNKDDAGPNNNWMDPAEAHAKIDGLFKGCMRGRTMYVIPYCMGPLDSPLSRCGVEITDSPYVVINMQIMTHIGTRALKRIETDGKFIKGLHSVGDLNPERRFIMHFPEELTIKSFGSGYGGNALLGKKCHALRIASWQARHEGWLAEHMLIVGIENPQGEVRYVAAAFPSACGKTNLAMLIPPASHKGWKVWTVGDDICWMHLGKDGRLWAINPEAGYFGVLPGTNPKTNKNAYEMISHDTIYTNVAVTANNQPWWEGLKEGTPVIDWRGRQYDSKYGTAAHPNSRFTVSARQNPSYSSKADDPAGVPISAIIFGGRRADMVPLVYQARDWTHGVLMGAGTASETTAAATGQVGVVRRDPMAMKPFCGYNFADYWGHWLSFSGQSTRLPEIFHVNWFRQDKDNKFLWPGFGENLRVLRWVLDRCDGKAEATETPIGYLPTMNSIDTEGLNMSPDIMQTLLSVDTEKWCDEMRVLEKYFQGFGERLPVKLQNELQRVAAALHG
ncbi:MAG: phosphoenolpyruvate carboxykinase (GTP) [Gammaproteobacteria bacterium]